MKVNGQKIHTRNIQIATYQGDPDAIIVEGILHDERLLDTYRPSGEIYPPGTVHLMIIRMVVKGPELIVQDISVEMPTVPHAACVETLHCLDPVKGMRIVGGFTAKVKDLVGGVKGCCHLLSLLTAMAPAAVQGAWSAMSREPIDPDVYLPMTLDRVKDTCWVWREDGPLMKKWKAAAQRQETE